MNKYDKIFINSIYDYLNFVFIYEGEFIEFFNELYIHEVENLYFGSDDINIKYMLESGQHVSNYITYEKFFKFIDYIDELLGENITILESLT